MTYFIRAFFFVFLLSNVTYASEIETIKTIKCRNCQFHIRYTDKVRVYSAAQGSIKNADDIAISMSKRLSRNAQRALNQIPIVIYHCDPSMRTGQNLGAGLSDNYQLNEYDYLTLLRPRAEWFQANPGTTYNRSWDQTYGVAAPINIVINGECKTQYTPCDTTTICDANLTTNSKDSYWQENILVHEFAHTIMNVGLANGNRRERAYYQSIIGSVYQTYLNQVCHNQKHIYSCSNSEEMWAEVSQGWFGATLGTDVNVGLETPNQIKKNLPELYNILKNVYGSQDKIKQHPPFGMKK